MNNQHWNVQEMPSSCKLVHVKTCVERTKGEQTRNIRIKNKKKLNRTQYRRLKKGKGNSKIEVKLGQLKNEIYFKKTFERTTSKITENKTNATNEVWIIKKNQSNWTEQNAQLSRNFEGTKTNQKRKQLTDHAKRKRKRKPSDLCLYHIEFWM